MPKTDTSWEEVVQLCLGLYMVFSTVFFLIVFCRSWQERKHRAGCITAETNEEEKQQ